MARPYINYPIEELEAEFEKARTSHNLGALHSLAYELSFHKKPRAGKLLKQILEELSSGNNEMNENKPPPGPQEQTAPKTSTTSRPTSSHNKQGTRTAFKPTQQQEEAVDAFLKGGSLKINAYAGTGKTSTLELLSRATKNRGQYLAFNRAIKDDATEKFPSNVNCSTTHGLAFKATHSKYKSKDKKMTGKVNAHKLVELLNLQEDWTVDDKFVLKPISQGSIILRTLRNFMQSSDLEPRVEHVPHHGSLLAAPQSTLKAVEAFALGGTRHVWERMQDADDLLPLGHDGYLKLWALSEPIIAADFILLDEAQDTNAAVLGVLRKQQAQMIYVGDRYQQIYEWRGAINAMEKIATDNNSYLTTSFRFGNEIAIGATSILSLLGERKPMTGNTNMRSRIGPVSDPEAILARTNALTIAAIIEELDKGKRPHLVGGDGELMEMLRGVTDLKMGKPSAVADFFGFKDWKEVVEFVRSGEGEHLLTFVNMVESLGEQRLMWALNRTVEEDGCDVVVSTAHKAKGREWKSVRLKDDFLKSKARRSSDPNEFSKTGGYDPAELRLFYVAMTRAKEEIEIPENLLPLLGMKAQPQPVRENAKWAPPRTNHEAPAPPRAPENIISINAAREARAAPPPPRKAEWTPPANWQPEPKPTPPMPIRPSKPAEPKPAKRKGLLGWLLGK